MIFTLDVKKIEELCYESEIYPIKEFLDVYLKTNDSFEVLIIIQKT